MNNNKYNYVDNMIDKTYKYSKKYNLQITNGTKGWNDEGDAFRHTFMEASMSLKLTPTLSKIGGNIHEIEGKFNGQDPKEENMDKWNNWQGRDIAEHLKQEIPPEQLEELIRTGKIDDIIAEKVMERMKKGQLITHPNDKRNYENMYGKNSQLLPDNRVYTFEEIKKMKPEEFRRNQAKILADFTTGKVIHESEAKEKVKSGELIYVNSYTRSDGTKVSEYYRRK